MDKKDIVEPGAKTLRLQHQKYGNGSYLIIFLILSGVFNSYEKNIIIPNSIPHSLGLFLIILLGILRSVLETGVIYFLVLWIMDLIRKRGKIERPINKKARLVVNIVFSFILVVMILPLFIAVYKSSSNNNVQLNSQQTAYINEITEKSNAFALQNEQVKLATQTFLDALNNKKTSEIHSSLQNLSDVTQAIQPKIDELETLYKEGVNLSESDTDKESMTLYTKAIEARNRENRKLTEIATLGLTIDWNKPTENQISDWTKLSNELTSIETEIKTIQAELAAHSKGQTLLF